MWFALLFCAGILATPLAREWLRKDVSDAQRAAAPGQFAKLSQGTTHYAWIGPEHGPVALCIHGLSTSSYVWGGVAKGLARMGYRVLVYDHYGRGLSDTVRGRQDSAFFLQQITDLLAHEKVESPLTVFGYSMGGAIAAHFVAAYPGKIDKLVLLAPAGMQNIAGTQLRIARDWPVIGDWLFLLAYPNLLRTGLRAEADLPGSVPGINALQHKETGRRGYFPAILSSLRGVLRGTAHDQHRAIAAAHIPVLAIWGQDDDVIPSSSKDALAEWNPTARQVVVSGAGHGVTYSHTDDVMAAFQSFCDQATAD